MKNIWRKKRWSSARLITILEHLELYIAAGVSVDTAVGLAATQYQGQHRMAIQNIADAVRTGRRISDELAARLGLSEAASGLIGHGESSGRLVTSLGTARAMLERHEELRRSCLSALTYPSIIGVAACGLVIGLVRGVLPQIIPMLVNMHVPLPFLTRCVIWFSDVVQSYGLMILGASLVIGVAFITIYRTSVRVRTVVQVGMLRAPLVGSFLERYAISVFLRSCGSLIEAGVSSVDSYAASASTVAMLPVRSRLIGLKDEARRGIPLYAIFGQAGFPPAVCGLTRAGEMSGHLGSALVRSADIMDRDMNHALKRMTSLIEPAMMIVMGVVVGAIALSIMMPIYDMSKNMPH